MVFAVWPRPSGGAQGTVIGHGCLPPTPRACSLAWEIQLSVTAQAGVSGVSQAVSSQCKGMAEAEAGSPGEADCKPSRGNGSSLLAVMLVPGLQLPAASDPHLPFIASILILPGRPYMWCMGFGGWLCSWRPGRGQEGDSGQPALCSSDCLSRAQRIQG